MASEWLEGQTRCKPSLGVMSVGVALVLASAWCAQATSITRALGEWPRLCLAAIAFTFKAG